MYLLARKDEVFKAFIDYLTESERHTGRRLCILKSDRGGEYTSNAFKAYTATHGILLEQGRANTPQQNSIAERFNRTIMERARAQMIHAAIPKCLWGEVVIATAHILNLSPTSSINDIPINVWQRCCAGEGAHLAEPSFLRVLGCRAYAHIHKSERRKLDDTAQELIHIGYEPNSKSYRLWDPATQRIIISRDVRFDESHFPLQDKAIHQIPSEDLDDINDNVPLDSSNSNDSTASAISPPSHPITASPITAPTPSLSPSTTPPSTRPSRVTRQPDRYGNVTTYAAVTRRTPNDDNPTFAQAMAGPDKEHWLKAMKVEFDSLVSHSVGRLIPRPKSANVLGGMWRFKRKCDTSGDVTKYKSRWVILGNHQIHGLDYFETYASVGVKELLEV